jgi:hypothetical protein
MTEPKFYKGKKKALVVHPEKFLHAVKSLVKAGKEDDYLELARAHPHAIQVHPEFVNAVKKVLHKHGLHENNPEVAEIISSPPGVRSCF